MASQTKDAYIEGVDFSPSMVSIARKKNKKLISKGKVNLVEGDFDTLPYQNESFEIPMLDEHFNKKYKHEFTEYSRTTKKFVPFIY